MEMSHGHGINKGMHAGENDFAEADLEHNEKLLENVLLAHQFLTVAVRLSRQVVDVNVFVTLGIDMVGGQAARWREKGGGSALKKAGQTALAAGT